MLVRWYIRRLDSLVNPRCPRPYLKGFGPGSFGPEEAKWVAHRQDATAIRSKREAFRYARLFGSPSIPWKERVRIVRVKAREAR